MSIFVKNKTVAQPEDKGNLKKFKQFEKRRDMVNKSHKISWEKQMEDLFNAFKPPGDFFFNSLVLEIFPNHDYILNHLVNTEMKCIFLFYETCLFI